ncbi:MAG: twin-arginine translocation signal domain-containing protein, partial [Proteobacteria bacterium]|nr:twin-arginine translocation signal domain-containing protein [Pseudomonadota bacterium]
MSENKPSRRDFLKGSAMGVALGTVATMGAFSYSPWRKNYFAKVERKQQDIGVCKSIKVTNISETSWFENATLMHDIKNAGGLLVNQYDYNWPPFGNGKGLGKGSYQEGIAKIKQYLPHDLDKAWEVIKDNCVSVDNAGGYAALIEVEELSGKKRKFLLDTGWSYAWTEESFKREGIDK